MTLGRSNEVGTTDAPSRLRDSISKPSVLTLGRYFMRIPSPVRDDLEILVDCAIAR